MPTIKPPTSVPVTNRALEKLDINKDGKVDKNDFPGLTDEQAKGVLVAASTMQQEILSEAPDGFTLEGKKVLVTSLDDLSKAEAKKLITASGGKAASSLSRNVDVLVVGDKDSTTKDDQAIRMNATGMASIMMMTEDAFKKLSAQDKVEVPGAKGGPYVKMENWGDGADYVQVSEKLLDKAMKELKSYAADCYDMADYGFDTLKEFQDSLGFNAVNVRDETINLNAGQFEIAINKTTGDVDDTWEH